MKNIKLNYMYLVILMCFILITGCSDTANTNEEIVNDDNETLVLIDSDNDIDKDEDKDTEVDINTEANTDTDVITETNTEVDTDSELDIDSVEPEVNTEATQLNGYYADAYNKNAKALKDSLNDIITENHGTLSYSQVYSALEDTDADPLDPSKVVLFYKGISVPGNELRMSDDGDIWNREHIWAKSHGDFGTKRGPGTDLHMIRPTDASVNTRRGHLDFDESDDVFKEAPDTYVDSDSFEPRDEVKGDVARMIFYMAVRYEGEDGEVDLEVSNRTDTYFLTDTGYGEHGKLDTLLRWHIDDPVDDFEENRNNVIHEIQGNRNPFIDHPEYVERIWGESLSNGNLETDGNSETDNNENLDNQDEEYIDTISIIRDENDGYTMTTSGIISYIESDTTLYIQDETGGLRVDSYGSSLNMYTYQIGQSLIVSGEIDTYKGEKEIKVSKTNDIIALNVNESIDIRDVYLADINDGKYQGELILVQDIQIISIDHNSFEIEDNYGERMNVYTGNAENFNSNNIEMNTRYDLVGIISWYNEVQIKLRDGNDINEK